MKIAASQLSLQSSHSLSHHEETQAALQTWRAGRQQNASAASTVTLSNTAKSLSSRDLALGGVRKYLNDALLEQLKTFIEQLTGRPIQVFDPEAWGLGGSAPSASAQAPAQQAPSQAGFSLDYHHTITETESTQVEIAGTVRTADGKTIDLKLQLSMDRSWTQHTDLSVQAGSRRTDPLVLNFDGTAAQLQDQRVQFDLNADGSAEDIPTLAPGSAYLAFDRNGNGKIDDGSELFGPSSGSGFSELAALDSDGNGWLDENDPAFSRLSLWTPQSEDSHTADLQPLAARRVGALYLGSADSPMELRGRNDSELGNIAKTGLYLNEDGTGGALQEVDLAA